MPKTETKKLIEALRAGDLTGVKVLVRRDPEAARSPQVITEAGRLGWKEAIDLLLKNGADVNAMSRGYRALHSLIQEAPHKGHAPATASRVSCLRWLLKKAPTLSSLAVGPPAARSSPLHSSDNRLT